ncbi:MAG: hypothetical protein AMS20_00030 [Gemmatimonas sp. SG8_28]|nr:MAG: hypothetical protein AMS20_00030 [Gemmatimonas sp. SG8_28]
MTTVAEVIRRARVQHPGFTEERHENLALLEQLSTLQDEMLIELVAPLTDLVSEGRTVADTISNVLVGVDENGSPYSVSTSGDGYDVIVENGFGYTGPTAIAVDPYSAGFVLPSPILKLVHIYAQMTRGDIMPVQYVTQNDFPNRSWSTTPHLTLFAIINGGRLVPITTTPNDPGPSMWDSVTDVTVVYVPKPERFTLTGSWSAQTLTLPEAFDAWAERALAAWMALRELGLPEPQVGPNYAEYLTGLANDARQRAQVQARKTYRPAKVVQVRRAR